MKEFLKEARVAAITLLGLCAIVWVTMPILKSCVKVLVIETVYQLKLDAEREHVAIQKRLKDAQDTAKGATSASEPTPTAARSYWMGGPGMPRLTGGYGNGYESPINPTDAAVKSNDRDPWDLP